jgi:DNA anti-recombination protein RmuC
MRQIAFDTLKFVQKLISSGMPERQAKAQVEVLVEVTQMNLDGLSTKYDLQETENRLRQDLVSLQHDLRETETRLEGKIDKLDAKIDHVHDKLNAKIDSVHDKLDAKIDSFHDKLDAKIDHVHDKLDAKIDHVHDKLSAEFNGKFKLVYWMLGIVITGVGSLVAGMVTYILK